MRLREFALSAGLWWITTLSAFAQSPLPNHPSTSVNVIEPPPPVPQVGLVVNAPGSASVPARPPEHLSPEPSTSPTLERCLEELAKMRAEQAVAQAAPANDEQKKRLDLLQKQVETLEKMVKLLADELKKRPAAPQAVEKLETRLTTVESRSVQAAQRDQELANAVGDLREQFDSEIRKGPDYPPTLKQLFDPMVNNETPLSIYGTVAFGFSKIIGDSGTAANGLGRPQTPGGFYFGEFTPDFLLKLNDWIFLEAELAINSDGSMSAGSFAQVDFFVNDWLTVIAGKFVAPIGWFNYRLNNPWINKLPGDAPGSGPLLWQQVLPTLSLLGVQATGSFYLGKSPLKMEYSVYVSNGLNLTPATPGAPTLSELANLQNMTDTFNIISNQKAVGGRLGLWWPEKGLEAGISGLTSGDYVPGFENAITFWGADFNYHKGDWDFRAEYGAAYQDASNFIGAPIRRQGFYAQIAYRPWEARCKYIQNLEAVYRYSYVTYPGIDANELDLTTFGTPIDVPIRRQQNEVGVNYYFYPRMVLKAAYQINDEPGFHLHDNQFITELAWGW
jgi:hypothetical protein